MDKSPLICAAKEELQDVMAHEAAIMREVLSNLEAERKAIIQENQEYLDGVLKERVALIEAFGKWSDRFCVAVGNLSGHEADDHISHHEALDRLSEWLDKDDFDLYSSQKQLLALLREIHLKNLQNMEVSRKENRSRDYLAPAPQVQKQGRVVLQLMDPGTEEE